RGAGGRREMRRATALAGLALLASVIVGFALGYSVGGRPRAQRMKTMTLLGVSRDCVLASLRLTTTHRPRVETLLTEAETRAGRTIDAMYQDVRSVTREAREQVRATLDASQRARLDSILSTVSELKPRTPLPPRTPRATP